MYEAHKRFFEVSSLMQGDAEGRSLMEDVLNACFDYSLAGMTSIPGPERDRADRLVDLKDALQRINHYVSARFSSCEDGLFQGLDKDVSTWSDDLTYQILANRPN